MMKYILILISLRCILTADTQIKGCSTSPVKQFPPDFFFGAASSSYQIEGAWNQYGKGESIWDAFTHNNPENIFDRMNGDHATESYDFYMKDIKALVDMKAEVYRFSISWPRILPNGDISSFNRDGADYYHRLIDELLLNNIEPMITMYHWELPQALQDLGGWTNPLIIDYFEQYANVLYNEYASKVKYWITLNEPAMYCYYGYAEGIWAPGIKSPGVGDYLCGHYSIIAHAKAYHLFKDKYAHHVNGEMGITLNGGHLFPKDPSNPVDVEAAKRVQEFSIGWFANPIFSTSGGYPQIMIDIVKNNSKEEGRPWSRLPEFSSEMIEYVKGTSDFFGLNYYTSQIVTESEKKLEPIPSKIRDENVIQSVDPNWIKSNTDWLFFVPEGLSNLLKYIKEKYKNPRVIITENGWADYGELNDVGRIVYMKDHLEQIVKVINEDNCNVIGYTAWSLVDGFEWLRGYTEKFGMFRVDINDKLKERIPKQSVAFYREIIQTRQIP